MPFTPQTNRFSILLVEDQELLRDDLTKTFREEFSECEIVPAANETEARKYIEERLFAVVVTDINLGQGGGGEEGGFTVLQAARKRDPHTQLIVVALHASDHHMRLFRELSVVTYINPLDDVTRGKTIAYIRRGLKEFENLHHSRVTLTVNVPDGSTDRLSFELSAHASGSHRCRSTSDFESALWKELSAALGSMAYISPEPLSDVVPQFIGGKLWNRLFRRNPELLLALGDAYASVGRNWEHVVLKFKGHRDILDVPFELLHDGNDFLALRQPVVVVPHGSNGVTAPFRSLRSFAQLRVLLIAANTCTDDLDTIPRVDEEIDRVAGQLRQIVPAPYIETVHSWNLSEKAIGMLSEQWWHIIHFAGHGTYRRDQPDESVLYYWDRDCDKAKWETACAVGPGRIRDLRGEPSELNAGGLRDRLAHAARTPSLVYLNCCHSARSASRNWLYSSSSLGLVDAAVQAGVPIVVGNRWPVRDDVATLKMVENFYERLRLDHTPEQALCTARQRTTRASKRDAFTWASPVMALSR